MLYADALKQREEEARRQAAAAAAKKAPSQAGGAGKEAPRKRGPIPKAPAREWLATAAWTAAGPQAVGLFCTLSLLANPRSLHLQIGQPKLAKLLGVSACSIARWAARLRELGMVRTRADRHTLAGKVVMVWQVWIERPAKPSKGAALPGFEDATHGCGPRENRAEERAHGAQP